MNKAGGKRETLLPSTGKLAREFFLTLAEPKFLEAFTDRLPPVLHAVHAGHEIEVFFNTQILPKTESLRHVTDFSFNCLTLADHIMSQDLATSVISAEQSAKHTQKCGLAAA